jgi:adenine phosphoribosyltransferase
MLINKKNELLLSLKDHIGQIPDFPEPGIVFYDISTLIGNAKAWEKATHDLSIAVQNFQPDILVGIEARGFLVAASLASKLNIGMQMIRKKGKLPGKTVSLTYDLEYGSDTIEIQEGVLQTGQRVAILDDVLATGGTMRAAIDLVYKTGATVACGACIIELASLRGRERLGINFRSLITYNEI